MQKPPPKSLMKDKLRILKIASRKSITTDQPLNLTISNTLVNIITENESSLQNNPIKKATLVDGNYHIAWVLNNAVPECMRCKKRFSFFVWRHHCRFCGELVCHSCSCKKVHMDNLIEFGGSRICHVCCENKKDDKMEEIAEYQRYEPLSEVVSDVQINNQASVDRMNFCQSVFKSPPIKRIIQVVHESPVITHRKKPKHTTEYLDSQRIILANCVPITVDLTRFNPQLNQNGRKNSVPSVDTISTTNQSIHGMNFQQSLPVVRQQPHIQTLMKQLCDDQKQKYETVQRFKRSPYRVSKKFSPSRLVIKYKTFTKDKDKQGDDKMQMIIPNPIQSLQSNDNDLDDSQLHTNEQLNLSQQFSISPISLASHGQSFSTLNPFTAVDVTHLNETQQSRGVSFNETFYTTSNGLTPSKLNESQPTSVRTPLAKLSMDSNANKMRTPTNATMTISPDLQQKLQNFHFTSPYSNHPSPYKDGEDQVASAQKSKSKNPSLPNRSSLQSPVMKKRFIFQSPVPNHLLAKVDSNQFNPLQDIQKENQDENLPGSHEEVKPKRRNSILGIKVPNISKAIHRRTSLGNPSKGIR